MMRRSSSSGSDGKRAGAADARGRGYEIGGRRAGKRESRRAGTKSQPPLIAEHVSTGIRQLSVHCNRGPLSITHHNAPTNHRIDIASHNPTSRVILGRPWKKNDATQA